MKSKTKKDMIATILKEARLAKGYTQQELSDRTTVSLRSIQCIENGEVAPRMYTLKTLAACLGIPMENILQTSAEDHSPQKSSSRTQRLILSIGLSLFIILLYMAYSAAHRFPETPFEASLGMAGIVAALTFLLHKLWPAAKVVLAIGFCIIVLLLAFAFVAQAPTFPETGFEALLYMASIVAFITLSLILAARKWQKEKIS